jgi:hypothetical protein
VGRCDQQRGRVYSIRYGSHPGGWCAWVAVGAPDPARLSLQFPIKRFGRSLRIVGAPDPTRLGLQWNQNPQPSRSSKSGNTGVGAAALAILRNRQDISISDSIVRTDHGECFPRSFLIHLLPDDS